MRPSTDRSRSMRPQCSQPSWYSATTTSTSLLITRSSKFSADTCFIHLRAFTAAAASGSSTWITLGTRPARYASSHSTSVSSFIVTACLRPMARATVGCASGSGTAQNDVPFRKRRNRSSTTTTSGSCSSSAGMARCDVTRWKSSLSSFAPFTCTTECWRRSPVMRAAAALASSVKRYGSPSFSNTSTCTSFSLLKTSGPSPGAKVYTSGCLCSSTHAWSPSTSPREMVVLAPCGGSMPTRAASPQCMYSLPNSSASTGVPNTMPTPSKREDRSEKRSAVRPRSVSKLSTKATV
mmetsp:Transcript_946/g.2596  ORF Transcript_946/g.2596 Transcript_946/m.2596 type:complete len:294 (+) Transcript_946:1562-2443(+)